MMMIVKQTLEETSAYGLTKAIGISVTPIQQLKTKKAKVENMRVETFRKILEYAENQVVES